MANSNYLSNYDKDTVNKLKEPKLLIIDLDGTLISFEKIDNIIIASLFPESRVINSIDLYVIQLKKLYKYIYMNNNILYIEYFSI